MIRSTVNMFAVFAGFGLGMTATKHVAEYRDIDPHRAGQIMGLSGLFALVTGSLIAVAVFVTAPWLAIKTINAPHLVWELRIGAVVLLFSALNGAQTGALAGFESFKTIARVNLWVGLVSFPIIFFATYFGGLRGAVYALAINMGFNWLLNHLALRGEARRFNVPISISGCVNEWPTLLRFSLPAALSGFMVTPVLWMCNVMMVNQPGGYGQMALFDAANQWRTSVLFIPAMVGRIVLPMLSSLNSLNDQSNYRKVIKYNIQANGFIALLIAVPVIMVSPWIMKSYGNGFESGNYVLVFLILTAVLMSITSVIGQAIVSKGRVWVGLSFNAMWAATLISLSYVLLNRGYGALGLAMASFFSYIIHSLCQYVYLYRLLKV